MSAKPAVLSKNAAMKSSKHKPLKERTSTTGAAKEPIKLDVTSTVVNRLIAKVKDL